MKTGLLLFAHGARDPSWAAPFEAVAHHVCSTRPQTPVRLAFLEFMSPSLPAAGAELVAAGCDRVDVVPLFLGAGGHVRKDVPALLDELRRLHPRLQVHLHRAIGEHPDVIATMAQAALAALPPSSPEAPERK